LGLFYSEGSKKRGKDGRKKGKEREEGGTPAPSVSPISHGGTSLHEGKESQGEEREVKRERGRRRTSASHVNSFLSLIPEEEGENKEERAGGREKRKRRKKGNSRHVPLLLPLHERLTQGRKRCPRVQSAKV